MSDKGWIKIHRKLYDNPYASDPHWVALWCYFLCKASRGGNQVIWKGERITLKPGQFTAGRKQISRETGISESKIYRLISRYKSEQQIEQLTSASTSLFTVLGWDQYQEVNSKVNSKRTASEQLVNTKQEVENIRREDILVVQDEPKPRENVPYQQILDLYHRTCKTMPEVRVYTPSRKQAVKNRYNQFKDHQRPAVAV